MPSGVEWFDKKKRTERGLPKKMQSNFSGRFEATASKVRKECAINSIPLFSKKRARSATSCSDLDIKTEVDTLIRLGGLQ